MTDYMVRTCEGECGKEERKEGTHRIEFKEILELKIQYPGDSYKRIQVCSDCHTRFMNMVELWLSGTLDDQLKVKGPILEEPKNGLSTDSIIDSSTDSSTDQWNADHPPKRS